MRPHLLRRPALAFRAATLAVALSACGNPAIDVRVDALGEEKPGVPPGPFHRPGQPCLLCHGTYGGEGPLMSVAGTIYATPADETPVSGAKVTLVDAQGDVRTLTTNCIGNFYVEKATWDPLFPLHAEIEYPVPGVEGATKRVVMSTRISRDGGCAGCHTGTPNQGSPGWVYCAASDSGLTFPTPDSSCEGVP